MEELGSVVGEGKHTNTFVKHKIRKVLNIWMGDFLKKAVSCILPASRQKEFTRFETAETRNPELVIQ